ncbi:MAG: choice-of-anchor B family protein [Candidatus Kapaibacterium sp.]
MALTIFRCMLFATTILFFSGTLSQAQETVFYNTALYDTLNPNPEASGRYSALWGYTAPNGREYALLGGFTGTHIIDITEQPIKEVAFIAGPNSGWREMKTFGTFAYVVSEGGAGMQIIDLRNLPESASLIKSDMTTFRTGHTIDQEGAWLYVHGSNVEAGANQGTLIFDVATDPLNPVLVGQYDRGYVHDAAVRNDTMYAAMINDGRLDIVYLGKDRKDPQLVTEISYPGAGTHNADLTIDGRYLMTTDEVGSTPKTLKVWDLSDIDDIVKAADWTPVEGQTIHNVHIKGTVAYIAWYTAGARIVDISDPVNPVEIGFYDMVPGSNSRTFGNWEVYPYFESGKIIASDMTTGLHVFTFDGAKKGLVNGTVRDSVTGLPLSGAIVDLPELGRSITTGASGHFQVLAAEGETNFAVRLLNYKLREGAFTLSSDGANVEILLSPLRLRSVHILPIDAKTDKEITTFAFDIESRGEGVSGELSTLQLPADSGYTLRVGAWGWLPKTVQVPSEVEGDIRIVMQRGYSDDAELDLGWSLGEPDDDGASSGMWERGDGPELRLQIQGEPPVIVEPGDDHTPDGVKAFYTGIIDAEQPSPGSSDIDSGRVTLTSPEFDLTTYGDPHISFWLWYVNQAFSFFAKDDRLYIRLSNNGGDSWEDVLTLEDGVQEWTEFKLRVADYMTPTSRMRFRIVAADSAEQGWVEAGLDDFLVSDTGISSGVKGGGRFAGANLQLLPNPLTDNGLLRLTLPTSARNLQVDLLDVAGRSVATIYRGSLLEGESSIQVDSRDLRSGIYYVRVRFEDGSSLSRKITLVK